MTKKQACQQISENKKVQLINNAVTMYFMFIKIDENEIIEMNNQN